MLPRRASGGTLAAVDVMISFLSADGEEREERWPSVERFRTWAAAERMHGTWRAYSEDDDGEWVQVAEGRC